MALEAYATATVNRFTMPASSEAALYAWRETVDQVREFITSECETNAGERISQQDLYKNYLAWHMLEQPSVHPVAGREFTKRVKANGFKQVRENRGMTFEGLTLKAQEVSSFYPGSFNGKSILAFKSQSKLTH